MNGIIHYYENELVEISKKVVAAEEEIENLKLTGQHMKEAADLDSDHRVRVEELEKSSEAKKNIAEAEQKLQIALIDRNFARDEIDLLKAELNDVKLVVEEFKLKNESLSKLKDHIMMFGKRLMMLERRLKGLGQTQSRTS